MLEKKTTEREAKAPSLLTAASPVEEARAPRPVIGAQGNCGLWLERPPTHLQVQVAAQGKDLFLFYFKFFFISCIDLFN